MSPPGFGFSGSKSQIRSIWTYSQAVRPRLSQASVRMAARSAVDFLGKAAAMLSRAMRWAGVIGPRLRARNAPKAGPKLGPIKRSRPKPARSPSPISQSISLAPRCPLQRHHDLAEDAAAFQPFQPLGKAFQRHHRIQYG